MSLCEDIVAQKMINVKYFPTKEMVVDQLTKPLNMDALVDM